MSTLPFWAQAALWGTVAGSGLLVGLLLAYGARPGHGAIARVMSFGAGALLSTASIQLTISAHMHAGTVRATIFLLTGAALVSGVNAWLAQAGAQNRKRCGECVPQDNERDTPGSGRAIAIGTIRGGGGGGGGGGIAITQGAAPAVAVVAGFPLLV